MILCNRIRPMSGAVRAGRCPSGLRELAHPQSRRSARDRKHRIGREVECGNPGAKHPVEFGAGTNDAKFRIEMRVGGGRRTRTFEAIRRLIYSQLPLPLGTLPRSTPSDPYPPERWLYGHR